MHDFYAGKRVDDGLLPWIYESYMLQHTSLSLDEIRSMDNGDFQIHLRLLLYFREAEVQASKPKKKAPSADEVLSGGIKKGSGIRKFNVNKHIDPQTGQWVDRD